jgi:hypothetical protein
VSDVLSTFPNPTIDFVIPPTVPVKVGLLIGAFVAIEFVTVLENELLFPSAIANSFNVSNAGRAPPMSVLISPLTYSVVAICVELVPLVAVGAVGVPVNAGEEIFDLSANELVNPAFTIEPLTNKLLLNELSEATLMPAFNDTSPALTTEPVNDGDARGAFSASELVNPVFTMEPPTNKLALNELSDATIMPAFNDTSPALTTDPVNDGDARGAFNASELVNPVFIMEPPTNKLLLNELSDATLRPAFKETSPALTTTPVNDGPARGALRPRELVNPVLTMEPPTYNPPLKDESDATDRPAFKETSPALTTTPVNDGDARGALSASELVNPVFTMDPAT